MVKKMHVIDVDFGSNLKVSFTFTDWELNRLKELQSKGLSLQEALGIVKNELRLMGFVLHPNRNRRQP